MRLLLSNGCSNTAGTDIDPNHLQFCHEKAWPKFVADHFEMHSLNIAEIGSGNEQIQRSTILAVSNLIERDNVAPENLVVAICWSGFDRYEYWNNDKGAHRSFSLSSTHSSNQQDPLVRKYVEYRSMIEPEDYANYKNLFYVYNTARLLESYGVEYYFSNCLHSFCHPSNFTGSDSLRDNYLNLLDLYNGTRVDRHLGFFDHRELFRYQLKDSPRSPYGNTYHWGEEGQKKYADFFIKHIERIRNANLGS